MNNSSDAVRAASRREGGSHDYRLDRIEQMQESNNRFLVAFSASVESLRESVKELTDNVKDTRLDQKLKT